MHFSALCRSLNRVCSCSILPSRSFPASRRDLLSWISRCAVVVLLEVSDLMRGGQGVLTSPPPPPPPLPPPPPPSFIISLPSLELRSVSISFRLFSAGKRERGRRTRREREGKKIEILSSQLRRYGRRKEERGGGEEGKKYI